MKPRPCAMRLVTRAGAGTGPTPPFGLAGWTPNADAFALWLDAITASVESPASVAQQVPPANSLPPSTPVVVLGTLAPVAFGWRVFFPKRAVRVPRTSRCGALLARGYVDIGAEVDSGVDVVWGWSPAVASDPNSAIE